MSAASVSAQPPAQLPLSPGSSQQRLRPASALNRSPLIEKRDASRHSPGTESLSALLSEVERGALSMVGWRGDVSASDLARIAAVLRSSSGGESAASLQSLVFHGGRGLGAGDVSIVADALAGNSTLDTLEIAGHCIGAEGIAALCRALASEQCGLSSLVLDSNNATDAGAASIGAMLASNKSLKTLSITDNAITGAGGRAILSAAAANHSLTHLDLADNELGPSCVEAVASLLSQSPSLRTLSLGNAALGSSCAAPLAGAVRTNSTLTSLDLTGNGITAEGARLLADALGDNRSLISLEVDDDFADLFDESLSRNLMGDD